MVGVHQHTNRDMANQVTTIERQRTQAQIHAMTTKALKEMASYMERSNKTEQIALQMALEELDRRRVNLENVQAGISSVDKQVERMRHMDLEFLVAE